MHVLIDIIDMYNIALFKITIRYGYRGRSIDHQSLNLCSCFEMQVLSSDMRWIIYNSVNIYEAYLTV